MPDEPPPSAVSHRGLILGLVAQAAVFTGVGLALWAYAGRAPADFVVFEWRAVLEGLAMAAGLVAVAKLLFEGFPRLGDHLVRLQAGLFALLGRTPTLPVIVAISLTAGIGEEALFRGGVQTLAQGYVGPPVAIAIGSVAFAVFHLAKPLITALLLAVGCLFGLGYWLTDSLLAVMIGHAVYDVWALRYLHRALDRLGCLGAEKQLAEA